MNFSMLNNRSEIERGKQDLKNTRECNKSKDLVQKSLSRKKSRQ